MRVFCPRCEAAVPSDGVNVDRMLAKCSACNAVFAFEFDDAQEVGCRRENLEQPDRFRVEEPGGETVVTCPWFQWKLFAFFAAAALFWNGLVWTVGWFGDDNSFQFLTWFLLPFRLMGVVLAYIAIALLVNKTKVAVGNGRLAARSGPLPFPGNVELDATDIDQLFVCPGLRMQTTTPRSVTSSIVSFRLKARLDNRVEKTVLHVPGTADELLFLEALLENQLGIVDRPMRGEVE